MDETVVATPVVTLEEFIADFVTIYDTLVEKVPLDSLSDAAKVQAVEVLLNSAIGTLKLKKELELFDAQISELSASKLYKDRQTSALDDAVRRDTAKIVCEALGIIKSAGNNAGAWWGVASKSINRLADDEAFASVTTDP
ncbi:MAG: hypothetical protein PHX44_01325 [Sulfurimonas sp.]|uniref:hypothetical protein n=1 Tax=Sulfurimonas sp. TaxID=2022749 RepID=UPI002605F91E|nr:hypothetical protein [Sulfurimonas sp.]MDD2651674.1 hypothetical protein [Sulfurimonas sp.]MDD3451485.1 hypothetical protein [Sulfurimonas sp.]